MLACPKSTSQLSDSDADFLELLLFAASVREAVLRAVLRAVDAAQSVDEIVIAAREEDLLTYAEL